MNASTVFKAIYKLDMLSINGSRQGTGKLYGMFFNVIHISEQNTLRKMVFLIDNNITISQLLRKNMNIWKKKIKFFRIKDRDIF